ncbi:MAG: thiamine pyrophosphate-dependent dehydrogenase E1 component subunit alpha [Lentisphaerae bacterium]|nr:thiamine pyrophosphate-dependent dehydrogenase E1 component subunit alpha [Lentisphaerota bacterium]
MTDATSITPSHRALNASDAACTPVNGDKDRYVGMLRTMLRSRFTDERLNRLYKQGHITGGVYSSIGQEAIGAATTAAGQPQDLYAPLIRNMAVHVGRGETVLDVFRQWLGRGGSPTRGRDGNIHYGTFSHGVYAMISHLGAMLPVVVGGVMARRRLGVDAVGFAYIGDGGSSTGDFHEAINFAAVFSVPVIFIIENNKYAYSTPIAGQFRCERLIDRAPGYGLEGFSADGNDALALYRLVHPLAADIRAKPRPIMIECDTMRMRGHGEHDDFTYVPPKLLERYRARDPIAVASNHLKAEGVLTAAEIESLTQACQAEVDLAYRTAMNEPPPNPDTLLDGVYANA